MRANHLRLSERRSPPISRIIVVWFRKRTKGPFSWPEDPMFCLACVSTVHFLHCFTRSVYDPIAFQQQKEHAPAEWSFSSFEEPEPDEGDPADWWKTLS